MTTIEIAKGKVINASKIILLESDEDREGKINITLDGKEDALKTDLPRELIVVLNEALHHKGVFSLCKAKELIDEANAKKKEVIGQAIEIIKENEKND